MTIDEFEEYAKAHDYVIFTRQQYEHVIDVFNDYELLLFDYYGRLKADMVTMLTEIQLEIAEFMGTISPNYDEAAQDISLVIQQKIDKLKRGKNDTNRRR